jgi:pimeloyl-ACP methyl ester carboxylesterase
VHVVGASFGGWIAAEMATMASPRLSSMTLIDPVAIKVDGWIYPFLFGMELPQLVATVFHKPMAALALAPPDTSIDTLAVLYELKAGIVCSGMNGGRHEATLEMMQMFSEEVMPHFREDAAVDETAGVGRSI